MYSIKDVENIIYNYRELNNRIQYIFELLYGEHCEVVGFYPENEDIYVTYQDYDIYHWDEKIPFEWLNMSDVSLKEEIRVVKEEQKRVKKLEEEMKNRIIEEREREEYKRLKEKYG